MIVEKTDIEKYINFLEKTLGKRRGYTPAQKQENIQKFIVAGLTDLESLYDRLKNLLKTGNSPNDFSIEDVKEMLEKAPEYNSHTTPEEEYKRLKENLIIVTEDLHDSIFAINSIMREFLVQYPATAVLEIFGLSLKQRIKRFLFRFFR